MKRLLFCLAVACLLLPCFVAPALSQNNSSYSPVEPRWGDTLTIRYNCNGIKASLTARDEIYAMLRLSKTDGGRKDTCIKLRVVDSIAIGHYVLEDSLMRGSFSILSPEKITREGRGFSFKRRDGVAARGVTANMIMADKDALAKELALYPDNFAAYITKWDALQYDKKLDEAKRHQEINNDLVALKRATIINPERYAAFATAYKMLGKNAEYVDMLKRLGNEFPLSPYTEEQLNYFVRNRTKDTATKEIRALSRSIALRFPWSSFAKEYLSRANYIDTVLTASMVKPIFDAWIQIEPNNYELYSIYLYLSKQSNIVSDTTVMFAQRLMDLTANRETMTRFFMNNPRSKAFAYRNAAQAFVLAGRLGQAFAAIKAAQALAPDADMQGELFALEGRVWKQSGQYALSETAFINAQVIGSKIAKDSALAVYKQIRGTDSGFAAFLKQKSDSIAGTKKKPAIPFTAKGLDGKTYDLAALKGKAVVLNFWFVDCPPCRVEIPGLNTLVKEFANKDVVFLALALDDEKDLKEFLKKSPFMYTIVPKAREVSQKYGVEGYPTHIVIDRNGMNVGRLVGGTEKRHEDLRPLIERALE